MKLKARLYTGKKGLVIDKIQISNWEELWRNERDSFIKDGLKNVDLKSLNCLHLYGKY